MTDHDRGEDVNSQGSDVAAEEQVALQIVSEFCVAAGGLMQAELKERQGSHLLISLNGIEAEETWGKSGQTLDALQLLLNHILAHRLRGDVRIMLDAGNYRTRRIDALKVHARELAAEVKSRNMECELEPLPSHERRIIHSELADDPDVETYSEGNDPDRHVVIAPRK